MTGFHSPSLHFHLGAWAITGICTFIAFWFHFLSKRELVPRFLSGYINQNTVIKLDFVAHITGITGLLAIFVSIWTGFVDASGYIYPNYFDLNTLIEGYERAMSSPVLQYKVTWTFIGMQGYIFAGALRLYFVNINKSDSIYNENVVIQILYAEATFIGFLMVIVVSGAGSIYMYGDSILSRLPILNHFLPGGDWMIPMAFFGGLLATTLIFGLILKESIIAESSDIV
jgi:hypothetical protein